MGVRGMWTAASNPNPRQGKHVTTLEVAFKKVGIKAKKYGKRWPRAKRGTRGATRVQGGIKNLHFVVGQ
jgi:hypothetical protein